MLAVLMLWSVPFEQQSMYMENLLSVVAGLVQSALVRALRYHSQVGDMYFEDTHILTPEAFRQALGVYQTIRQRRMGDHVLVRLSGEREMSREVIDRYSGDGIDEKIRRALGTHPYKIKSKTMRKTDMEMAVEVRVKKNDMRFADVLRKDDAIHDLTLVQYSGDYID